MNSYLRYSPISLSLWNF